MEGTCLILLHYRALKLMQDAIEVVYEFNLIILQAFIATILSMPAVRIRDHVIGRMEAHEQEVCGLKWSPSGHQLASGGNDNLLYIWDASAASNQGPSPYLLRLDDHRAAVKALAWCPFQSNLLASGGGTADRCIKFWNTHTGVCLNSIDTQSQVCM